LTTLVDCLNLFALLTSIGKNAIKPGNYIRALIENPEKNYGMIHDFAPSTMREAFTLRPGEVTGFDGSVLGTEDDAVRRPTSQYVSKSRSAAATADGSGRSAMVAAHAGTPGTGAGMNTSSVNEGHHTPLSVGGHHHHHHHHHHHSSKSSSPHHERGDRSERGEDGSREHRHKKKVTKLELNSASQSFSVRRLYRSFFFFQVTGTQNSFIYLAQ